MLQHKTFLISNLSKTRDLVVDIFQTICSCSEHVKSKQTANELCFDLIDCRNLILAFLINWCAQSMMVNRIFALVLCSIILCNEIYSTQLPDVIETTSGLVRGNVLQTPFSNTTFRAYRGIPYAEAPIGKRRFKVDITKN